MKWAHSIRYEYRRGSVRAVCVCGGQSHWGTEEYVKAWCDAHTRIKEKKGTPAREARDA